MTRQIHYGGDKLFIDYSGQMPIVNQRTGKLKLNFVTVLGKLDKTYVHASMSQSTKDL